MVNSPTFVRELRWENGMHSLCRRWYVLLECMVDAIRRWQRKIGTYRKLEYYLIREKDL